jgi:hypothetical protein
MNNGIFKLDWANIKSSIVYGVIMGVGAMFAYAASIGDIFALDWRMLVNTGIFGMGGALLKNLLTTNSGEFLGFIKTKSD